MNAKKNRGKLSQRIYITYQIFIKNQDCSPSEVGWARAEQDKVQNFTTKNGYLKAAKKTRILKNWIFKKNLNLKTPNLPHKKSVEDCHNICKQRWGFSLLVGIDLFPYEWNKRR